MVAIAGAMKLAAAGAIESLQSGTCLEWQSKSTPARCLAFDRARWAGVAAELSVTPMRFCIDRFEYPNRFGGYPLIAVTWDEAQTLCHEEGKRLCTEDEWTFACEGEAALPYPYGFTRDASVCVIDRLNPPFDPVALTERSSAKYVAELDRLWRGERSGTSPGCRSTFGVYDLTGNVDEWTSSTRPEGFRSILKGGYWGPIRARCRPSTRAHAPSFAFYQQGFRCCSELPERASEPETQERSTHR
jgi:hypothetical protein